MKLARYALTATLLLACGIGCGKTNSIEDKETICVAGEYSCQVRTLRLCNDSRTGWIEIDICGEGTRCDVVHKSCVAASDGGAGGAAGAAGAGTGGGQAGSGGAGEAGAGGTAGGAGEAGAAGSGEGGAAGSGEGGAAGSGEGGAAGTSGGAGGQAGAAEAITAENSLQNANDTQLFGEVNNQKAAQDFVATSSGMITKVVTSIQDMGNCTESVVLHIYQGGSVPEEGTLLGSSNPVAGTDIANASTQVAFQFSGGPIHLQAGTKYYLVFVQTGVLVSTGNNVMRLAFGPDTYSSGRMWTKWKSDAQSAWSSIDLTAYDHVFQVWVDPD